MKNSKTPKAKLALEDGSFFEGFLFGHWGAASGEAVFQTGMVGYAEAMTDPSYYGQILVFTYPLIGNYGISSEALESASIRARGIVVSEYAASYSHWRAESSLEAWMKREKVPGICGVDTRALTKKLRSRGTMLAKIVPHGKRESFPFYDPNHENVVANVSPRGISRYGAGKLRIALLDCGAKENIVRCLLARGVSVIRFPHDADIFAREWDGLVVSNGPGDPKQCKAAIATVQKAMERSYPIFGICLGSQLLALASKADTYKLAYGHRSQNQPCENAETKKCYVTTQNHGFAVDPRSLPNEWNVWFWNINDRTVEGVKHARKPFISVQFHPEASPGPTDTEFLFDEFLSLCKK